MDFYLKGMDSRVYQEGVSAIRFYAPKGSKFKYEISIGRVCEGTKMFDTSKLVTGLDDQTALASLEGGFWIDLHFPQWEKEIANDTIVITCDIVDNMNSVASTQKVWKLLTK